MMPRNDHSAEVYKGGVIEFAPDNQWLEKVVADVKTYGLAVIGGVLDACSVERGRDALYEVAEAVKLEVGESRLARAREAGETETRLVIKYHDYFLALLELSPLLQIADELLSPTCTLRFMNGAINDPNGNDESVALDARWHMNCRQVMNGFMAYLDFVLPFNDMTPSRGSLLAVPGSHQVPSGVSAKELEARAKQVCAPCGGLVVFDSTLWHRQKPHESSEPHLYVDIQLARSFIKPHFDYVRALGHDKIRTLPERTRQLLGWYTRVPTSLAEFYVPPDQRLYRAGQD